MDKIALGISVVALLMLGCTDPAPPGPALGDAANLPSTPSTAGRPSFTDDAGDEWNVWMASAEVVESRSGPGLMSFLVSVGRVGSRRMAFHISAPGMNPEAFLDPTKSWRVSSDPSASDAVQVRHFPDGAGEGKLLEGGHLTISRAADGGLELTLASVAPLSAARFRTKFSLNCASFDGRGPRKGPDVPAADPDLESAYCARFAGIARR